MSVALLAPDPTVRPAKPAGSSRPPRRTSPGTLIGRLNLEWAQLSAAMPSDKAVQQWAARRPALAGATCLEDILVLIGRSDVAVRDAVLLALLQLAQAGEELAGRTVLQAMLGKAVRIAAVVTDRPDMGGDRQESLSAAVAALWQVIATYPVGARPSRVAANLALDTVALVQRGHTGSSHLRRSFPEVPYADVSTADDWVRVDTYPGTDEATGPVDAELFTVLAWAVRHGVLQLAEAQLLARVYGVDEHGVPVDGRAVATEEGLSWSTLRQRCHRLARRLRAAVRSAGDSLRPASPPPPRSAPPGARAVRAVRRKPGEAAGDCSGPVPSPLRAQRAAGRPRVHRFAWPLWSRSCPDLSPPDSGGRPRTWRSTRDAVQEHPTAQRPAAVCFQRAGSALSTGCGCWPRWLPGTCTGREAAGAPAGCRRRCGPQPVDWSPERVRSAAPLDCGCWPTNASPPTKAHRAPHGSPTRDGRAAMRARRVHAVGAGLGLVLALSTGCSDAEPRRLDLARPSTSPPPPSDGAGPTAATTPRPPDAPAASEHERILAQYRKYFTAQTLLIRAPAAQRPALLAEVAVDPSYSRTLAGLAAADAAGEIFYGEITLHPVVVSVNRRTAELRDCQDASQTGRMKKATGEKVTVGRDGDELLATMARGDDGLWRMSRATYQSAQC